MYLYLFIKKSIQNIIQRAGGEYSACYQDSEAPFLFGKAYTEEVRKYMYTELLQRYH